jgi:dipeptidyl aminopeptidase/acylaminoacyl peptidase
MSGRYAHQADLIVYGFDSGGNEREQLFTLRGYESRELAVDPAVMHMFGAISWDDRRVAFSDNRRHPAFFDVYLRDIDGSNERCVYEQDGSNFVSDWSRDGRFMIIYRMNGSMNSDLFLLDVESGEATHLTPHEGIAVYNGAQFTPDGRSIYLRTDQSSEFLRLAHMDLHSRELAFLTPDDQDIETALLSPDGTHLAMVRNESGYGRLVVLSLETGEECAPAELPDGVAMQLDWSRDGRRIAFTFTTSAENPNIWIWDIENDSCRQATFVTRGGIPRESLVEPELVTYRSFDGLEVPAFLYIPLTPQPLLPLLGEGEKVTGAIPPLPRRERGLGGEGTPPVILFVHGGPESQYRPAYNPVIQYFVSRGYAVLAPNVRGSTGYGRTYTHLDDVERRMDSVADLEAAVRWLRHSGRVDAERVAVMGGSYGGFMVLAALSTYPDVWAAGVDIVGIANFETFLRNTGAYRRHWRIPEYGDPDRHADLFRRISPIHHADRIEAPLIVVHGTNDPRVPLSEAEQIVAALERRGRPVRFLRFDDEGHGLVKLKNKLVAYPAIAEFLDEHLARHASEEPADE